MIDRHHGSRLSPKVARSDSLAEGHRYLVVHALYPKPDSVAGSKENSYGTNFNVELVYLIGFQKFPLSMGMIGLPSL